MGKAKNAGEAVVYSTSVGPIIVTPNIENGPFIGVWVNSPKSPWETNVDFARQAARELGCVVRCDPGQHYPQVHPYSDIVLEIQEGKEKLMTWEQTG